MLGHLLGNTIKDAHGEALLAKVEEIRQLSKSASAGNKEDHAKLIDVLQNLPNDQLLPVARAFSQFLNLTNIAEQYHSVSRHCAEQVCNPDTLDDLFIRLKHADVSDNERDNAVDDLKIELVLTAHPTEIARRTTIHKLVQINKCLSKLELGDLSSGERAKTELRLEQLIAQAWHSDVIRKQRPTPLDEAKWGYAVIENSLWQAVPEFLRQFDQKMKNHLGRGLGVDASPIQISSWMGGDRDGNPFVTADVTHEVLLLSRWKAADLYLGDIQELISELSMTRCNDVVRAMAGDQHEPYRAILKSLRQTLTNTLKYLDEKIHGRRSDEKDILTHIDQLWTPLHACYQSLHECGMGIIADGLLLDTLRRIRTFGVNLIKLDIRQESTRHADVLSEVTRTLGMGDYSQWSEQDKQAFLIRELSSKRPLLPRDWEPSDEVQEVLDTCRIVAQQPRKLWGPM
ncbi:Phosphoenolpyruvate carboxylase [Grimontia hollisae]|uniref:Phosphoenolpyruvate carboxylase n=1 Tax=Grimontia hollisae TaxID=673 RepID=A0A377HHI6_GRIHO|nr:Phosphoenolpyruvate carboxylase [Grimontia hollisae]